MKLREDERYYEDEMFSEEFIRELSEIFFKEE